MGRGGQAALYAQRLRRGGGRLAGRAYAVSPPGGPGAGAVQLAPDGRRGFLATWVEASPGSDGGLRAQRLGRRGRPQGPRVAIGLQRGSGAVVPADAHGSRGWLYAFSRERARFGYDVAVHPALPGGRPSGSARRLSEPSENAHEPSIARVGRRRFLVAWGDHAHGAGGAPRVRARSIVAAGR